MKTLTLLLLALSLTACQSMNQVDWRAVSRQTNQAVYGNPEGYIQPSNFQQPQQQQQQRQVDLRCVQELRNAGYNMAMAHHQCSY